MRGGLARAALLAASALVAACGVAGGQSTAGGSTSSTPIRIGVVTGLTGTYAQLGEAQQNGAQLAIQELHGKAGNHPISVLVRDDQIKPDLALSQAKSLVQVNKVDFLTG